MAAAPAAPNKLAAANAALKKMAAASAALKKMVAASAICKKMVAASAALNQKIWLLANRTGKVVPKESRLKTSKCLQGQPGIRKEDRRIQLRRLRSLTMRQQLIVGFKMATGSAKLHRNKSG